MSDINEPEQPTMIFQERRPMQVNIPSNTETTSKFTVPHQQIENKKSVLPWIIAALFGLLLLAAIGIGAIFLLKPSRGNDTAVVSNNSANSNININSTNNDQSKDLQDKLANLERRLQEQQNQKKTNSAQPFPSPPIAPTINNSGTPPTAKVKPSSDGFLSLRTEPNVKTGTQLIRIPTGATVRLENCEKNFITVDGRRGRWCMISYNGETGWAFDAWLAY